MRHRRLPLAALLVTVCAASFTGCNCGSSSRLLAPPLPPLSAIKLTPATDTLVVGQTRQFVASAFDTNSVAVAGAAFDWSSGNPNVFTVSGSGLVTAVGEGVTKLIAAAGGKADTSVVAVVVQNGWYTQASGTINTLNGVCFLPDGRSGWAVGDAGTIVHTNTAGASWSVQPSGSAFTLNGVWFTTDVTGFVVGHSGTVLRTRNGGDSWTRLATVPAGDNLYGVCFADTAHGWAVGTNGTILRTADAGQSWTKLNPTASQLNGVSFSDTTDGWAVGEGGVILGTHDSGRSWYLVQPALTAQALRSVWRLSAQRALVVGAQGANPFTAATPDSLDWTLGNLGASNDMYSLHMVDDLTGYAVGTNGTGLVLKTLDGGGHWSPQVSNTSQTLNHVWFVDALRGWAVGVGGRILHTSKGGL
jgi:photosystem II stability/assembly factor-like uncharacterized protein